MTFSFTIRRYAKPFFTLILTAFLVMTRLGLSAFHAAHASGTIIVNSLSDDQSVGGICSQVNVLCLREAMLQAANTPGGATINFTQNGRIYLTSTLAIDNPTNPVIIDGSGAWPALTTVLEADSAFRIMNVGLGKGANLTINDLVFRDGVVSSGNGGALYNDGQLTITNSEFLSSGAPGVGGAVYNDTPGTATISGTTFQNNTVSNYGGAVSNYGTMTISGSTFLHNSTPTDPLLFTYGGAVQNAGTMLIQNSTFNNNTSGQAGAVVNYGGHTTIANSTIDGNTASASGGGLANTGGTLSLLSDIVAQNTSPSGPDINTDATVTSYGYNLIGNNAQSGFVPLGSDLVGTSGSPIDPSLGPLQNNGGLTDTMATIFFSPAIGAGNCAGAASTPVAPAVLKDQRGDNRKNTGSGLGCNIGAYESSPPANTATPTATNTATFAPTATATATLTATATSTSTPSKTATSTATTPPVPKIDTIGIYRSGTFYLRLHNSQGFADLTAAFTAGSKPYPVVGDWTGAGFDSIGVMDQNTANFYLRNTISAGFADEVFTLGNPNDTPLSGRWLLSATHAGAGVYRPSNGVLYLRNALNTGFADYAMIMGIPGDEGIAGDWTGKGFDSPGIYRPGGIAFYLSNQITNGVVFADISLVYGSATDLPIAGDWIAQGHDGVGMFRPTNGFVYLKNALISGFADNSFFYGIAGDVPIAGHWVVNYPPIAPAPVLIARTAVPAPNDGGSVPGSNQIGG